MRLGLKGAILHRRLSQRETSRLADIPESRLSSLINGWSDPSQDERRKLSAVLHQPANVLFDADTSIEIRSGK